MPSKDALSRVMPVVSFGDTEASVAPEEPTPLDASSMSKILADLLMNGGARRVTKAAD